ncbi:MAG TPA: ribosomal protein S18-alanine N-acetyltransferase [Anaerolineaceae bacterium]|nr:ribosomal protein S18-alanine N-acetyltransferase [Anaerolineaceae bacterium]
MELIIRPMTLEDVERVYEIDCLSFSLPWPERSYRFELTQNPNSRPWVAEVLGAESRRAIAGMLVLWVVIDEGHIGTIAIHPDWRRRGIAQCLLAHALLAAVPLGIDRVMLEVRHTNLAAQALYRRFGFVEDGIRRRYYRDNGEDAILMSLSGLQSTPVQSVLSTLDVTPCLDEEAAS